MDAFAVAPLILVFPAVGLLFNALLGRRFVDADRAVGERWSGWVASVMALASFVVAIMLALSLAGNGLGEESVTLFDWISVPSAGFHVPWAIQVDTLSVTMMLVVTGVGSLIHIYAIGYMHGDPDFSRFFVYMNLFLFFMLVLVTGSSYLMLFVGWEGVGLCSYLLIGFWFDRVDKEHQPMNANAARKAFVVNRVGDFGMILAMILMFWAFESLDFNTVFHSAEDLFREGHTLTIFGLQLSVGTLLTAVTGLFLLGAAGKSAQIPLYVWLPDAMAGPTPVSALIHAATMVTAGIYLTVRSNVFFEIVRESGVGPCRLYWSGHGFAGRPDRIHPVRHQKSIGLLDYQPVGFYDRRCRDGRLRGGHVSPGNPRFLQGSLVSEFRFRDPRHGTWSSSFTGA